MLKALGAALAVALISTPAQAVISFSVTGAVTVSDYARSAFFSGNEDTHDFGIWNNMVIKIYGYIDDAEAYADVSIDGNPYFFDSVPVNPLGSSLYFSSLTYIDGLLKFSVQNAGSEIYTNISVDRVSKTGSLDRLNVQPFLNYIESSHADFDVSVFQSVPEPSTWILVISAFGFIGGVLRFRQIA